MPKIEEVQKRSGVNLDADYKTMNAKQIAAYIVLKDFASLKDSVIDKSTTSPLHEVTYERVIDDIISNTNVSKVELLAYLYNFSLDDKNQETDMSQIAKGLSSSQYDLVSLNDLNFEDKGIISSFFKATNCTQKTFSPDDFIASFFDKFSWEGTEKIYNLLTNDMQSTSVVGDLIIKHKFPPRLLDSDYGREVAKQYIVEHIKNDFKSDINAVYKDINNKLGQGKSLSLGDGEKDIFTDHFNAVIDKGSASSKVANTFTFFSPPKYPNIQSFISEGMDKDVSVGPGLGNRGK
jgi:hypothetical protein